MSLLVVVVVLYPLILLSISVYRARSVTSHDDFMVAGRSVPVYMLVGTLVCTWIGSGSLFGASGLAYTVGISELWFSSGAWIGLIVAYFLAGRVRRIADYTVPDLLERRYNPTARILGTVTIILAYVAIASYQFRGGGWILAIVTDGARVRRSDAGDSGKASRSHQRQSMADPRQAGFVAAGLRRGRGNTARTESGHGDRASRTE